MDEADFHSLRWFSTIAEASPRAGMVVGLRPSKTSVAKPVIGPDLNHTRGIRVARAELALQVVFFQKSRERGADESPKTRQDN